MGFNVDDCLQTRSGSGKELLELVDARHDDGRIDLRVDDQTRPILLAVSENGQRAALGPGFDG
jgi:putative transposase